MKKLTHYVLFIAILLLSVARSSAQEEVTAQPDAILTQHWAMPTLLNPAATGDIDFIRVRGAARMEYLGSHDSPKNFMGAADSPFKVFGKRIGAGIIANSQSYGLFRNYLIGAQGSYKFKIKKSMLSIGVQIGYFHTMFKGSELTTTTSGSREGSDENGETNYPVNMLPTQDVKAGVFDVGLGVKYSHPKFHAGVSLLHLTNATMDMTQNGESTTDLQYIKSKLPMTLYFDAGGNIALNNTLFTLQPSVLIGTDFHNFQGVAEMRATYNQKFTFGVDYRWNRAAGVVAALSIKNFYVGYNWEYDYSTHPKGSTGNHELVIGYQFKMDMGGNNKYSQKSIRLM